jgi:hypothetical protein
MIGYTTTGDVTKSFLMVIRVEACPSSQHSVNGSSIPTAATTDPGLNATNTAYP